MTDATVSGLRVLALLTDGFGTIGGIGRYNRDLLAELAVSGAVTRIVALPRTGACPPSLPSDLTLLAARPARAAWMWASLSLALRHRFDVVFCGHLNASPWAAALARLAQARLWLQVHGIEAWQRPGRAVHHAVGSASLVTSVSRTTRQRLLAWADVAPERVRVLPNVVPAEMAPRPRRADLIARYGLAGRRVVLTVGRLVTAERYKGHDRVIRALPMVAQQCPQAAYLVVGDGDDRARLAALARETGVADRVVLAGYVPDGALADYYALADVFAMPSTGEGFGIVLVEAAACGLPVIAGDSDGSRDALADGRTGRLVDVADARALTAALVEGLTGRMTAVPEAMRRFSADNFRRHVDDLATALGGSS